MFGFLEDHLDCRFFSRDEEYVPERYKLSLAPFEDAQKPAFPVRGAVWGVSQKDVLGYKLRAGGEPFNSLLAGHSISTWANAKVNLKEHPEYLQLVTYGYFNTLYPPKTLKPNPKFWVCVVSSSLSQNHGRQLGNIFSEVNLPLQPFEIEVR